MQGQNRKVALVLGGGSARGLAHIGVLKVLKRNNVPVDLIVGTSMGALIGAIYGLGLPLERAEEKALQLTWWRIADFVISKMGFLEGRTLERLIKESTQEKGFEDLKIPLAVVTTDIETGEELVITSGDLTKVIRASCSLPGIFIPIRIGGRLLVDGGLKNSVPSDTARRLGASFIIAVDVGFCVKKGRIGNIFQMLFQSIQIAGSELNRFQARQADVAIQVHMDDDIDQMAFDRAAYIMKAGESAANDMLPVIWSHMKEAGIIT